MLSWVDFSMYLKKFGGVFVKLHKHPPKPTIWSIICPCQLLTYASQRLVFLCKRARPGQFTWIQGAQKQWRLAKLE